MRDFEPKFLAVGALFLASCQSEPQVNTTAIKEIEAIAPIVEPTRAVPTPTLFVAPKPFIPKGWDRLLTGGTQDELYDWVYRKIAVERYELKLLDFGKIGTGAEIKDMRDKKGVDVYTTPDFGRIGYQTGENLERGTQVYYRRRLQLYIRDRLEEDWIIRQHEITTSSQADRPLRPRRFIPFQKGSLFFVTPDIPLQEPEVLSWSIL